MCIRNKYTNSYINFKHNLIKILVYLEKVYF